MSKSITKIFMLMALAAYFMLAKWNPVLKYAGCGAGDTRWRTAVALLLNFSEGSPRLGDYTLRTRVLPHPTSGQVRPGVPDNWYALNSLCRTSFPPHPPDVTGYETFLNVPKKRK